MERDRLQEELKELNTRAFDAVDLIRKGLPDDKRAIPGFLCMPGEGWASYTARFQRVRVGTKALKRLEDAVAKLESVIDTGGSIPQALPAELADIADALDPIARIPALEARQEKLEARAGKLETELEEKRVEVRRLRHLRRYAVQDDFAMYDEQISELDESISELDEESTALRTRIEEKIVPHLAVCERVAATQDILRQAAADLRSATPAEYETISNVLQSQGAAFNSFDASYRRYFLGDAEWGLWVRPLVNWLLLILLMYVIFMSFNTLIYRQWSRNEKLIYPIAEATSVLAASGDPSADKGRSVYKSGLFWAGFALAAGILGWNHLASSGVIPNVSPIRLQTLWLSYVGGGIFRGLGSTYFCIIFAVIGLSFLVPANISFSLWGFEVLYMIMLMVMAWLGYGANRWQMGNPGRFDIGSGAAWVFGFAILWTCRNYILCLFRPKPIRDLPDAEQKELRWSSGLFFGAGLLLFLMLVFRLDTAPLKAVKWLLLSIIVTIAVVRAVCEAGVLGIEGGIRGVPMLMVKHRAAASANAASNAAATAASGAHLGIFSGIVLGMKAFIAPLMANILKLREDIPGRRLTFHIAIWTGLVVSIFIAVVSLVSVSYHSGANSLFGWTNSHVPKATFNAVKGMASVRGAESSGSMGWWITGVILMALLLFGRQKIFGIPHPIGLVMLINPVMFGFWGSVMLGWLFKSLASKYCSKEHYLAIRCFFIGLIVGHLVAALFGWDRMEWHLGMRRGHWSLVSSL